MLALIKRFFTKQIEGQTPAKGQKRFENEARRQFEALQRKGLGIAVFTL